MRRPRRSLPNEFCAVVSALVFACWTAGNARTQEEPEPPLTEQLRDESPDGKYAMRIAYDAALNAKMIAANSQPDPSRINSETMYRVELVETVSGKALLDLMEGEDNLGGGAHFEGLQLMWSLDSKWFAYHWSYPRVGYTTVYHLRDGKWRRMNQPEKLSVPTKGDVRNEYISPVRWTKPGVLELKQIQIYRGEGSLDGALRFAVRFDGPGKFKIVSRKAVPLTDE